MGSMGKLHLTTQPQLVGRPPPASSGFATLASLIPLTHIAPADEPSLRSGSFFSAGATSAAGNVRRNGFAWPPEEFETLVASWHLKALYKMQKLCMRGLKLFLGCGEIGRSLPNLEMISDDIM